MCKYVYYNETSAYLAVNVEGEVRKSVVVASKHVLALDNLLGADLLGDGSHRLRRSGQDGSTGVDDGLSIGSVGGTSDTHAVHGDLPVGGGEQVDPSDVTSVVSGVSAAQHQLTLVGGGVA